MDTVTLSSIAFTTISVGLFSFVVFVCWTIRRRTAGQARTVLRKPINDMPLVNVAAHSRSKQKPIKNKNKNKKQIVPRAKSQSKQTKTRPKKQAKPKAQPKPQSKRKGNRKRRATTSPNYFHHGNYYFPK